MGFTPYLQSREESKQRIHPGPSIQHWLMNVNIKEKRWLADVSHYGIIVLSNIRKSRSLCINWIIKWIIRLALYLNGKATTTFPIVTTFSSAANLWFCKLKPSVVNIEKLHSVTLAKLTTFPRNTHTQKYIQQPCDKSGTISVKAHLFWLHFKAHSKESWNCFLWTTEFQSIWISGGKGG